MNNCSDNGADFGRVGSVGVSKQWRTKRREVRVDALSRDEWLYLFGLFLADGARCSFYHGQPYENRLFLQWDERELAERVVCLLERTGLRPILKVPKRDRMVEVRVGSVVLLDMLPDGWSLMSDASLRERFFDSNGLLTVSGGIPFFAGLLDGDGYCGATLIDAPWAKRCVYGVVNQWHWTFVQSKFPFLVDYVKKFLRVVSPKGGLYVQRGRSGFGGGRVSYHVSFSKQVISALLDAGIAGYSWKAARWQGKVARFRSRRASYYRLSEAARVLHVNRKTVWRWIRAGKVRYVKRSHWFYIPAREMKRLMTERGSRVAQVENHVA